MKMSSFRVELKKVIDDSYDRKIGKGLSEKTLLDHLKVCIQSKLNINDIIRRAFENSPKLENGNAQFGTKALKKLLSY